MTDPQPTVQVSLDGHVATITLDDARRRNAMSPELGDALAKAVAELRGVEDLRCVVLTGAGDTFSGGGDLAMLERLRKAGHDESRDFMKGFYARYLSVLDLEVPTIAAVRGAAIGAGLCVALACTMMVVDDDAKLAVNFAQLGLSPGMGATYLVPLRAGAARGAELLLTGRRFSGRDAVAMGMALSSAPAADVLAQAQSLAAQVAASAPLAVRAIVARTRIDRAALQRCLDEEASAQAKTYASLDLGEGLLAARERRAPTFTGR